MGLGSLKSVCIKAASRSTPVLYASSTKFVVFRVRNGLNQADLCGVNHNAPRREDVFWAFPKFLEVWSSGCPSLTYPTLSFAIFVFFKLLLLARL